MKIEKNYIIVIIILFIVFSIILLICLPFTKKNIYTEYSSNGSKLPKINIDSSDGNAINEYLDTLYKKYTSDGKSKFNYTYFEYKNILSILIIIDNYDEETNNYIREYMSFNIDKETKKYITKEELVSLLNSDLSTVKTKVESKLNYFYQDEINEKYVEPNECDFACYISYLRNLDVILEDIVLVIEDNQLVAYTNFDTTFSDDAEYFMNKKENYYRTVIKEL